MQIINNINSITFSHNGRNYIKNFIVIKQGTTNIAIHNSFDTRHQLVSSTHFNQFNIDGIVYSNQADLMEALAPILFSKAGVNGDITTTSQLLNDGENGIHPFITANDLPLANQIINQTGYNVSGDTITMNSDWVWVIQNIQYFNSSSQNITIPAVAENMQRIDIVVATTGNSFNLISGVEVEDNPIAPPTPINTIVATFLTIGENEVIVEPTPVGDEYMRKADEYIGYIGSSTGTISNLFLKNYTNYIFLDSSSVTQVNSASFLSSSSYIGKRIRFTNKQSSSILFKNNFGIGTLKFELINNDDFELKADETLNFLVKDDFTLFQTIEINPSNIPSVTGLEKITEGSNTGWRLIGQDANNYGNIGSNAIDVSFSPTSSTEKGATGTFSFTEGVNTIASGSFSHAQNTSTTASGSASHSEGSQTIASGSFSHAEGSQTIASGQGSHSEGENTQANGEASHAEGAGSIANGLISHAGGYNNTSSTFFETVIGGYSNIISGATSSIILTDPVFRIGIGASSVLRKDGLRLYKNGAFYLNPSPLSGVTNNMAGFFKLDENSDLNIHNGSQWNKVAYSSDLPNDIVSGTLTSGRIPYASTGNTLTDTNNLKWTNTTKILDLNGQLNILGKNGVDGSTTAPESPLRVTGGNGGNTTLPTGVVVAGNASEILLEGGNGGNALSSVDFNIAGKGADVYCVGGDGGLAIGGTTNLDGGGGNASLQGGETRNGIAGFAAVKAGNASGTEVEGGCVYIVPGFGDGLTDTDESLYNGTVFINLSPNLTSVRGNTVIGNTTDDRINRLQVTGKVKISSSVQVGNNSDVANSGNTGAIRYREVNGNSHLEISSLSNTGYTWNSINEPIKNQIKNGYEYFNDFDGIIANNYNDTHFIYGIGNSGTLGVQNDISYGVNDILRFSTESLFNGRGIAYSQNTSLAYGTATMITSLRVTDLATTDDRFYTVFAKSTSATSFLNAIFFCYDRYNELGHGFTNDNWIAVCRSTSSVTAVDTGIPVDVNNYQKLQFDVVNLAVVNFYINNVLVASITDDIITQNVASVSGIFKTLGTSNVSLHSDYIYKSFKRNNPRI